MVPISVEATTDSNAKDAGQVVPHIEETKSSDDSEASALESSLKARIRELEVQNSSLLDRLASLEQVVFPTAGR